MHSHNINEIKSLWAEIQQSSQSIHSKFYHQRLCYRVEQPTGQSFSLSTNLSTMDVKHTFLLNSRLTEVHMLSRMGKHFVLLPTPTPHEEIHHMSLSPLGSESHISSLLKTSPERAPQAPQSPFTFLALWNSTSVYVLPVPSQCLHLNTNNSGGRSSQTDNAIEYLSPSIQLVHSCVASSGSRKTGLTGQIQQVKWVESSANASLMISLERDPALFQNLLILTMANELFHYRLMQKKDAEKGRRHGQAAEAGYRIVLQQHVSLDLDFGPIHWAMNESAVDFCLGDSTLLTNRWMSGLLPEDEKTCTATFGRPLFILLANGDISLVDLSNDTNDPIVMRQFQPHCAEETINYAADETSHSLICISSTDPGSTADDIPDILIWLSSLQNPTKETQFLLHMAVVLRPSETSAELQLCLIHCSALGDCQRSGSQNPDGSLLVAAHNSSLLYIMLSSAIYYWDLTDWLVQFKGMFLNSDLSEAWPVLPDPCLLIQPRGQEWKNVSCCGMFPVFPDGSLSHRAPLSQGMQLAVFWNHPTLEIVPLFGVENTRALFLSEQSPSKVTLDSVSDVDNGFLKYMKQKWFCSIHQDMEQFSSMASAESSPSVATAHSIDNLLIQILSNMDSAESDLFRRGRIIVDRTEAQKKQISTVKGQLTASYQRVLDLVQQIDRMTARQETINQRMRRLMDTLRYLNEAPMLTNAERKCQYELQRLYDRLCGSFRSRLGTLSETFEKQKLKITSSTEDASNDSSQSVGNQKLLQLIQLQGDEISQLVNEVKKLDMSSA